MRTIKTLFVTVAILGHTIFTTYAEEKKEDNPASDTGLYRTDNARLTGPLWQGGKRLNIMNPAISLIIDGFYYHTNLSDDELETRKIPGYRTFEEDHTHAHGETRKGFNLRSAELSFFAPVDPYFNLYITIPVSENGAELEEAYFVTTSLPAGLQLKGGRFRSGFGRFNAFHQHARNFVDPPLPYRAFLGDDGLVEKGIQVTYLPALPVCLLVGVEALEGENEILLGKEGRPSYGGFVKTSVELSEAGTVLFGISFVTGETVSSSIEHNSEFEGNSILYGVEFTYKWRPSRNRSLVLQGEYMLRKQRGEYTEDTTVPTPVKRLERSQDGLYLQGLYRSGRWRAGVRYDTLGILKDRFVLAGTDQDFGGSPYRITASVEFIPTEFSRIRPQYNIDRTSRDGSVLRELFLQFIMSIGAHGAHRF